ncbi:hypothetical protein [Streptomyces uncialis]|uniref:hypothetical protein n=1 Tax=Streptomyces uncialis TaxID=1048205 RepID=UPI00340557A7
MIVVYTPDDGSEPEQYDARSLLVAEASALQRVIDQKWAQVKANLYDEDLDAMRGIVWVLKKRVSHGLAFGDFNPGVDAMVTRMDRREVEEYVTDVVTTVRSANPEVTGELLAHALREVPDAAADAEHARRLIEEATADGGKDEPPSGNEAAESAAGEPSPTPTSSAPDTSTSASSPTSSTSHPELSTA